MMQTKDGAAAAKISTILWDLIICDHCLKSYLEHSNSVCSIDGTNSFAFLKPFHTDNEGRHPVLHRLLTQGHILSDYICRGCGKDAGSHAIGGNIKGWCDWFMLNMVPTKAKKEDKIVGYKREFDSYIPAPFSLGVDPLDILSPEECKTAEDFASVHKDIIKIARPRTINDYSYSLANDWWTIHITAGANKKRAEKFKTAIVNKLYWRIFIDVISRITLIQKGVFSKVDALSNDVDFELDYSTIYALAKITSDDPNFGNKFVPSHLLKTPQTQKICGMLELLQYKSFSDYFNVRPLEFDVILDDADFGYLSPFTSTRFARPCPKTPRHGFVDSRPVNSITEAKTVFAEAKMADPDAEMLIGEFIDATHNMIWANGMLTIGLGHDGATSGKDTIVFPTLDKAPLPEKAQGHWKSIKESPFFEFVAQTGKYDKLDIHVTQLRDGPATGRIIGDYIPREVEVTEVVMAEGDLLEWEARAAKFTKGTVVWHPKGAICSHYAIHCFNNNVPYITENEPKVGDVLTPTTKSRAKEFDRKAFAFGVSCGMEYNMNKNHLKPNRALEFVLAVLHNFGSFDKGNLYHAALLGLASVLCVRLGFTAAIGEARHSKYNVEGKPLGISTDRQAVYVEMWQDFGKARSLINTALGWFYDPTAWIRSGFGGIPWFKCTFAAIELWNKICLFKQNKIQANKVIDALNLVINTAHNNGRFLNKFVGAPTFNTAANNPSFIALVSGPTIYKLSKYMETKKESSFTVRRFRKIKCDVAFKTSAIERNVLKQAQCNLRPGIVHIQWVHNEHVKGAYESFNVAFDSFEESDKLAIIAAIAYPDANDTVGSLAGTERRYVPMDVKENRYLTVYNSVLDKHIVVWDASEMEPALLVPAAKSKKKQQIVTKVVTADEIKLFYEKVAK